MRRGTTPTHTFTTDIDLREATKIYITYQQGCRCLLEKTIDDVIEITEDELSVKLSQEDTLMFKSCPDDKMVEMQIRGKYADGEAVTSNIMTTNVEGILKEGVI